LRSVVVRSADHQQIAAAVVGLAREIRASHPEVRRIIWFGSWVTGIPTPGSDVDLCLLLSAADEPFRERAPKYLPAGFPTGIDLFAYTEEEFERLATSSPSWRAAIDSGRDM